MKSNKHDEARSREKGGRLIENKHSAPLGGSSRVCEARCTKQPSCVLGFWRTIHPIFVGQAVTEIKQS